MILNNGLHNKDDRNDNYLYGQLLFKTDEELRKLFIQLRGEINRRRRKRKNTHSLEIEYCYVQKELQERRDTIKK